MKGYKPFEAKLKKALKKNNTYSPMLDQLIEQCAKALDVSNIAYCEILNTESVCLVELTREGNDKSSVSPSAMVFKGLQTDLIRYLRELGLTVSTLQGGNNDEVDNLIDEVNSIDD